MNIKIWWKTKYIRLPVNILLTPYRIDILVNIALPMFMSCNIMHLIVILQFYLRANVSKALSLAAIQKFYKETAFKGNKQ